MNGAPHAQGGDPDDVPGLLLPRLQQEAPVPQLYVSHRPPLGLAAVAAHGQRPAGRVVQGLEQLVARAAAQGEAERGQ